MKKKLWMLFFTAAALLAVTGIAYVNDSYHSDPAVLEYFERSENDEVKVQETEFGLYLDGAGAGKALIFYPGAKVEYTAYLPLLYQAASRGLDCFLVRMPCNLAFLGRNKASEIMDAYEYDKWYLAGHSLGGAMAAAYASGHSEKLEGLALLAAYPTRSLKEGGLAVVSVYGSEDGVLNREKLEGGRRYMPEQYTEICIEGGNHALFGNYGEQKGDKRALIGREEQQEQAIAAILKMAGIL